MSLVPLANPSGPFIPFGIAHVGVMALTMAAAVGLSVWARVANSAALAKRVGWAIAIVLVANELIYMGVGLATTPTGTFARKFLPIHICGAAVYLTAWVMWRPNRTVYELAYFWGVAGTAQAILTPNLTDGFGSYWFIQYFITHGGIVIGVLYATWALRMRPARGAVLRVLVLTNVYMLVVALIDWLLGANYMFLCEPPAGQSPFFFLPWPWYILFIEAVALVMVTLLYLPFVIGNARPGTAGAAAPGRRR